MIGYHFVGKTLRDGRPVPRNGVTLKHKGPLRICESGLHFSKRIIDALKYAPPDWTHCCKVECSGVGERQKDKAVCRRRRIVKRVTRARFERIEAPARADYERARTAAWADYWRARAAARADFERALRRLFD